MPQAHVWMDGRVDGWMGRHTDGQRARERERESGMPQAHDVYNYGKKNGESQKERERESGMPQAQREREHRQTSQERERERERDVAGTERGEAEPQPHSLNHTGASWRTHWIKASGATAGFAMSKAGGGAVWPCRARARPRPDYTMWSTIERKYI